MHPKTTIPHSGPAPEGSSYMVHHIVGDHTTQRNAVRSRLTCAGVAGDIPQATGTGSPHQLPALRRRRTTTEATAEPTPDEGGRGGQSQA